MFGILEKASANYSKLVYDFEFNGIDGNKIELSNLNSDSSIDVLDVVMLVEIILNP